MSEPLTEYLWIAVLGGICAFVYSFGIGANDVANAFASSVSSKSLSLKQAVIAAGIFEFCGALFLGASVTDTIRGKIIDISLYEDQPEILLLGMFTSLFTAMFMLLGATYYGLPVSTTHTIVGCIIGFSVAAEGFDSVDWEGTRKIFISWIASPLISGTASFVLFGLLRFFVLRSENAYTRAYYTFPLVLFVGVFINVFYILKK
jgi:sodium-dependent phosphate transporter